MEGEGDCILLFLFYILFSSFKLYWLLFIIHVFCKILIFFINIVIILKMFYCFGARMHTRGFNQIFSTTYITTLTLSLGDDVLRVYQTRVTECSNWLIVQVAKKLRF